MYAMCMKNTILYCKAKNALYKRHGWNYEKILLYQYVIVLYCDRIFKPFIV